MTDLSDQNDVVEFLKKLSLSQLKDLARELGLSIQRIEDFNTEARVEFIHNLMRDWTNRSDNVAARGGATWNSLEKALRKIGQNGIADEIKSEKGI